MKDETQTQSDKNVFGPNLWFRDEFGLLKSIKYVFEEDGSIDWRATIPSKFKYPNKHWFFLNGKETPESVEGLTEDQMVISLKGLKWAAKIRGYSSVDLQVTRKEDGVVGTCSIVWNKNYENPDRVVYTEVADATKSNTDTFCEKFLETVAANRAFCRCVRNFLNINSVSEEEIDSSQDVEKPAAKTSTKPQDVLEKLAVEKGHDDFKSLQGAFTDLGFFHDKMDKWVEYKNVPAKCARELIAKLKDS